MAGNSLKYLETNNSNTTTKTPNWQKATSWLLNLYDEVTVRGCPLQWEVMPFDFTEMRGWKLIALFVQIMSMPVRYKSCQIESKINYYSWFLSRGTRRLIKWNYKKTGLLLLKRKNNLITACKPLSWNLCHVRPLSNVEFLMSAEYLF